MFVEIICDFYLRLTIYVLIVIYLLFLNCTICILQFYCALYHPDCMDTRNIAQIFLDFYFPS